MLPRARCVEVSNPVTRWSSSERPAGTKGVEACLLFITLQPAVTGGTDDEVKANLRQPPQLDTGGSRVSGC